MSELINNSGNKKALLKHMILQLHEGVAPDEVKKRIVELLKKVPYNDVVQVEQELINEGLPAEEVLKLCDLHSYVLDGSIDHSGAAEVPPGHPVDVFRKENQELLKVKRHIESMLVKAGELGTAEETSQFIIRLRAHFNNLMDVDKHYRRKENLLFPYLEKYGITGPPMVMWGKHDEIRDLLRAALEGLGAPGLTPAEIRPLTELLVKPAIHAVEDMVMKEEEILLPMTMDKLTQEEWYQISLQTPEIGFCLYDPKVEWKPEGMVVREADVMAGGRIQLPGGNLTIVEMNALLNHLPVDITFVDRDDKVAFFSQGKERIFDRNRAILQRDVRLCHPPSSVGIVDQIIQDFRSGKASSAPFWIQRNGQFIHIEYFAVRDEAGEYLGTLEVSQNLTGKRSLQGEQRLLSYTRE